MAEEIETEASIRRLYRSVELAVREGTMLVGHDGTVAASWKASKWLGITDEALVGGPPVPAGWRILDEDGSQLEPGEHPAAVAVRTGSDAERVLVHVAPDGTHGRPLRVVAHLLHDEPSAAVDVVVADHEQRRRVRADVEQQEARFRTLTDTLPVAVYEASTSGEITYVNPMFTRLTGYTAADAPDLPMLEIVHPDDLLTVMESAGRAPNEGEYAARYRVRHLDGSVRWVISRMTVVVDADGRMTGFAGSLEDVDELHRAEREAKRLADIVESASDAVAVFEGSGLVFLNRTARTLLERTDPAFAPGSPDRPPSAPLLERYLDDIAPVLHADRSWYGELNLVDNEGAPVHVSVDVSAEVDPDGSVRRAVLVARDIREQRSREEALHHVANHDPLTGLANRHGLDRHVRTPSVLGGQVAALYLDIDHFKGINDRYGHAVGDQVLVAVARRLAAVVRSTDLVARLGGDEIVVWAPGTSREEAAALAARLVRSVNVEPVHVTDRLLDVTVTVGVAVGDPTESEALIGRADLALYQAKRTGRNRWHLHGEQPTGRAG